MYILKSSLKNLVRNKGRNLAIEQYRESFGVQERIGFNWEKMNQEHPTEQFVDDDGSISMEQNFEVPLPDIVQEYDLCKIIL